MSDLLFTMFWAGSLFLWLTVLPVIGLLHVVGVL